MKDLIQNTEKKTIAIAEENLRLCRELLKAVAGIEKLETENKIPSVLGIEKQIARTTPDTLDGKPTRGKKLNWAQIAKLPRPVQ